MVEYALDWGCYHRRLCADNIQATGTQGHTHKMTTALTDYLTRLSDSITQQKPSRLSKLFNQTSDPIQHVLRALHSETRGKVEKSYLANVIHRRGTALGLEDEWKTIVLERVWAGWMEENESWIEA
jgi:hypothetical protein